MSKIFHSENFMFLRRGSTVVLAVFFLVGFILGFFPFFLSESASFSLMRRSVFESVSIVGFFLFLLPFLISVLAVIFSAHSLLYFICLLKAFLFSYISFGLIISFREIGWFIRIFILFGDIIALPVLYLFWHQYISGKLMLSFSSGIAFFSIICLIWSIQMRFIIPLITEILFL